MFMALSVQAADSRIVYGLGVDATLYDTKNVDVIPAQTVGFTADLGDYPGAFGFVIPDEAVVTFTYGWTGQNEDKTDYYIPAIYGYWYFSNESTKWEPFFVMAGNYTLEDNEGTTTKFAGEFGLGTNYKLDDTWGIWSTHTMKVGSDAFYHGVIGLYFDI